MQFKSPHENIRYGVAQREVNHASGYLSARNGLRRIQNIVCKASSEERKRMGIEPTRHRFGHLTGFEDRGDHQISKRFRV